MKKTAFISVVAACMIATGLFLGGCSNTPAENNSNNENTVSENENLGTVNDIMLSPEKQKIALENKQDNTQQPEPQPAENPSAPENTAAAEPTAPTASLAMSEDYRASFVHGDKPAQYQKYIVLHDTETNAAPSSIISSWDNSGKGVAAHFVIGKDGSITQCVPLDKITHHAGYGDTGHNTAYGISEDGRDDMVGTTPIGSWASDYGMNAWSIGIEMVHVSGDGYYPEEQLNALDAVIAYIDSYYGFQSAIIDHKAWRSGNSDTSPEFAEYLGNYQNHRTHR